MAVAQNGQQQTANKQSSTKSNASGSTTLKKIVPHQLIKQARNMSNDTAHTISQNSTNQKLLHRVRTSVDKTNANYSNISANKVQGQTRSTNQAASLTRATDNLPMFMANLQQRSLQKQFDSIEMSKPTNNNKKGAMHFVVNTLTTANQRANSKSSSGSSTGFIQKLTNTATQQAGIQITHGQSNNA